MILHVFNPSHDEALAINREQYCPSSAARRTGAMFWDVAKHWAAPGDVILRLPDDGSLRGAQFVSMPLAEAAAGTDHECSHGKSHSVSDFDWAAVANIEPWGWDRHIVGVLRRLGAPERLLPTADRLDRLRELSSRHTAVKVLERLAMPPFTSRWCTDEAAALAAIEEFGGRAVLKLPWSCSGRGVWTSESPSSLQRIRKSLREQGAVEVEPLYENIADFAMEFFIETGGAVRYEGLSFFATHDGGGYAGNVVAPQSELQTRLEAKVAYPLPLETLSHRLCTVLADLLAADYNGPLGVDMMLTPQGIHPCIEVNLRNTMGRVALFQSQGSNI